MRKIAITCILIMAVVVVKGSARISNKQSLKWEVGFHKTIDSKPAEWYQAIVPGAVQLDYARAKNWGDVSYGENWKEYRWMEDVFWSYKTAFQKPEIKENERCFFLSKGIDYQFDIYLNNKKVFAQEGMFKAVELDLTDQLQEENTLLVKIYPIPKIKGKPENRSQAAQCVKPAVSYLWDWHPRLVPSGIWDETFIEIRNTTYLTDVYLNYVLAEDFSHANISVEVEGVEINDKFYIWELKDANGKPVLKKDGMIAALQSASFNLKKPMLWWTHDHGTPYLYTFVFKVVDKNGDVLDEVVRKTGFRRIHLVMHEGAWSKPDSFPKGRSNPPITIELNGRKIFGKGSNWVNPDIFPGTINRERYNGLLDNALKANFNLFRVWGGGIVNKEAFYELCNEKGILVWTEFPLACNNYIGTPHYLRILQQESEAIIKRIRKHASNALWSGGNELFNGWSGMTDQSLALRLLNSQCFLFDPKAPFIPTAPLMGMAHGHYVFKNRYTGEEVYQWMARARATAYTEFGMPGASSVELLKKIIPEEDLFPPMPGTSWESHHAFNSWQKDTWLMKDLLASYFGEAKTLEELVGQSQWLQSEGYKCIYEEARRQKPMCAMSLNWCYNEPWITAANNSIINYPNQPKPSFYAVANACRPILASARISKFAWNEGETFSCDLFVLNDLYEKIPDGEMIVKLKGGENTVELLRWKFGKALPNENIAGPTVRKILPHFESNEFDLLLEVIDQPELSSVYRLKYQPKKQSIPKQATRKLNE